jgi:hypothetical protein
MDFHQIKIIIIMIIPFEIYIKKSSCSFLMEVVRNDKQFQNTIIIILIKNIILIKEI